MRACHPAAEIRDRVPLEGFPCPTPECRGSQTNLTASRSEASVYNTSAPRRLGYLRDAHDHLSLAKLRMAFKKEQFQIGVEANDLEEALRQSYGVFAFLDPQSHRRDGLINRSSESGTIAKI